MSAFYVTPPSPLYPVISRCGIHVFLSTFIPPILAQTTIASFLDHSTAPKQILSLFLTLNPFNIESIRKTHLGVTYLFQNPALASCGTWNKIWISNPGPEIPWLIWLCLSFQTHFMLIFSFSPRTFIVCCSLTHCWLYLHGFFVVVQLLSCVRFFETPWSAACQTSRLPGPSLSPRVCSNSCPLSWWCHPISSSVVPFFCLRSFPALGSFPVSQLFASGSQSIGVSASASVLPKNIQGWFSKELTILVYSGCYNKNTMDWVACKQQKFISPSPGVWKVQYQDPHRVCVWWGSTSLFKYSCVFTVSLYGRRDE